MDLIEMLRERAEEHGGDKLLEEAVAALSQQRAVVDAERMLWLVVRASGGSVLVPCSVILAADWSKCELVRQDLLDGIRFTAAPSPEQEN